MASLECKVCFEKYDCVKQRPFLLKPCGHTFCLACIDKFSKFKEKRCPKCNTEFEDKKSNDQLLEMLYEASGVGGSMKNLEASITQAEKLNNELKAAYETKVKGKADLTKSLNGQINAKSEKIIKPLNTSQRKLLNQVNEICENINKRFTTEVTNHAEKLQAKISEAKLLLNSGELTQETLNDFIQKFVTEREEFTRLVENSQPKSICIFTKGEQPVTSDPIGKLVQEEKLKIKTPKPEQARPVNKVHNASLISNNISVSNKEEKLHYHMTEAVKSLSMLKMKKAIEHLDEIIKINPSFHDPFGKKAYALGHLLRYEESLPYYALSLQYEPEKYQTYFHMGEAYRELSLYKESVQAFKQCIRLEPRNMQAYLETARVFVQAGAYKEAIEYFDKANVIEPNNFNYAHYKSLALMASLRFDEAQVYLDAALVNNPHDFQLHIAKAGIYKAKGRPDLALRCYDKAVMLNPHDETAKACRSDLARIVGKK